jgi:hypothetical protein
LLAAAAVTVGAALTSVQSTDDTPVRPCEASQLRVSVSASGEGNGPQHQAAVTSSVRNVSPRACTYASSTFEYLIETSSGTPLGGGAQHGDAFGTSTLRRGEALTGHGVWDPRDCSAGPERCTRAPDGNYVVVATWMVDRLRLQGEAAFTLGGAQ